MSKYHINPNTGNPGVCHAAKNCPFGDGDHHYGTAEEARVAYEKEMASSGPNGSNQYSLTNWQENPISYPYREVLDSDGQVVGWIQVFRYRTDRADEYEAMIGNDSCGSFTNFASAFSEITRRATARKPKSTPVSRADLAILKKDIAKTKAGIVALHEVISAEGKTPLSQSLQGAVEQLHSSLSAKQIAYTNGRDALKEAEKAARDAAAPPEQSLKAIRSGKASRAQYEQAYATMRGAKDAPEAAKMKRELNNFFRKATERYLTQHAQEYLGNAHTLKEYEANWHTVKMEYGLSPSGRVTVSLYDYDQWLGGARHELTQRINIPKNALFAKETQ